MKTENRRDMSWDHLGSFHGLKKREKRNKKRCEYRVSSFYHGYVLMPTNLYNKRGVISQHRST